MFTSFVFISRISPTHRRLTARAESVEKITENKTNNVSSKTRKYFQRWRRSPILLDASICFVFVKGEWKFFFRVCCVFYKVCILLTDNDLDQIVVVVAFQCTIAGMSLLKNRRCHHHYRNESVNSVNEWKREKTITIFCFVQFSS